MFGRRNRWPLMMFTSQMTCKKRKGTRLGGREAEATLLDAPINPERPKQWSADEKPRRDGGVAGRCFVFSVVALAGQKGDERDTQRVGPFYLDCGMRNSVRWPKWAAQKPTDCGSHTLNYRWCLPKKATRSHTDAHDRPLNSFISRQINLNLFNVKVNRQLNLKNVSINSQNEWTSLGPKFELYSVERGGSL